MGNPNWNLKYYYLKGYNISNQSILENVFSDKLIFSNKEESNESKIQDNHRKSTDALIHHRGIPKILCAYQLKNQKFYCPHKTQAFTLWVLWDSKAGMTKAVKSNSF